MFVGISLLPSTSLAGLCFSTVSAAVPSGPDILLLSQCHLPDIFDSCVRSVFRLKEENLKVGKPRLCYYMRSGMQLDRCKMMRHRKEGIGLNELVDREQEHTVGVYGQGVHSR